jgi:hypothetical protein
MVPGGVSEERYRSGPAPTLAGKPPMVRLLIALLVAAALAAVYFFVALNWSYSTGERAGWVQKLSKKGWVCKTWEGELALVSLPGSSVEKFYFTIRDDAVAQDLMQQMGKRVSLHYEEKVGLPTSCFGETRYFVTKSMVTPDIPIGPGVSVPSGQAPRATPNPVQNAAPAAPASAGLPAPTTAPVAVPAMPTASAASAN